MRRVLAFAVVSLATGVMGCRSDILHDPTGKAPSNLARLNVVPTDRCEANSWMVAPPQHCAWSPTAARARVLEASIELVALVSDDGRARGVRILKSPGYDLDAVATDCAMHAVYDRRPRGAAEGDTSPVEAEETCPLVFHLRRYPSDVAGVRPPLTSTCLGPETTVLGATGTFSESGMGAEDCHPYPAR